MNRPPTVTERPMTESLGLSRCLCHVLAVLLLSNLAAIAQDSSSILSGRVLDIQGAGIPGAVVKVKNTETGLQRQAPVTPRDTTALWLCLPGTTKPKVNIKGFPKRHEQVWY